MSFQPTNVPMCGDDFNAFIKAAVFKPAVKRYLKTVSKSMRASCSSKDILRLVSNT